MTDDLDHWQQTLAAEHATIWGYGLVGSTPLLAAPAEVALGAHRARRTRCADAVVALGGEPVTSASAYDLAAPVDAADARRLASDLEHTCSAAYVVLAGAQQRPTRLQAAQWLRESAIAMWNWSGQVDELPGLESAGLESEGAVD
jgi:hypothetical protein